MRKLLLLLILTFIVVSCGNNSNSKAKFEQHKIFNIEQSKLDSIEQVKNDSLKKVQAIQDDIVKTEIFQKAKKDYYKTITLRNKYIGFKYEYPKSTDFIAKYGRPKTLNGTDNNKWVAYFPKGDITVVSNKKTNKFENICVGKYQNLKYDATIKLSKLIGKRNEESI